MYNIICSLLLYSFYHYNIIFLINTHIYLMICMYPIFSQVLELSISKSFHITSHASLTTTNSPIDIYKVSFWPVFLHLTRYYR